MLERFCRIQLPATFVILLVGHAMLYASLNTESWLLVAIVAALVDTGIVAVLQLAIRRFQAKARR